MTRPPSRSIVSSRRSGSVSGVTRTSPSLGRGVRRDHAAPRKAEARVSKRIKSSSYKGSNCVFDQCGLRPKAFWRGRSTSW